MCSVAGAASSAYRSAAEQAEWARRRSLDLGGRAAGQVSELRRNTRCSSAPSASLSVPRPDL